MEKKNKAPLHLAEFPLEQEEKLILRFSPENSDLFSQLYAQTIPKELLVKRKLASYDVKVIDIRTNAEVDIDSMSFEDIHKNVKFYRMIHKSESYNYTIQFVGLEVEMRLNPHIYSLRTTKWKIDNIIKFGLDTSNGFSVKNYNLMFNSISNIVKEGLGLTKEGLNYLSYFINQSALTIFNNTCTGFSRPAHLDGVNLEVAMLPMSQLAFEAMEQEIQLILHSFLCLGYKAKQSGCGIHTHYSLNSLGETKEAISKTMIKFLWFLFKNPYLMCILSNRHYEDSVYADIFHLINEDAALLTPTHEIKAKFIAIKDEMINNWLQKRVGMVPELGVMINKRPKENASASINESNDTVEFRWWASTNKFKRIKFNMLFSYEILLFIKSVKDLEELRFTKFYQYLIDREQDFLVNKIDKILKQKVWSNQTQPIN